MKTSAEQFFSPRMSHRDKFMACGGWVSETRPSGWQVAPYERIETAAVPFQHDLFYASLYMDGFNFLGGVADNYFGVASPPTRRAKLERVVALATTDPELHATMKA